MANMQIVPATKNVEAQIVEMRVPLYSYGCEKKVKKALAHLRGIHSVHVDYDLQKVTVWGICDRDVVLASVRKKRRESRFWNHQQNIEDESDSAEEKIPPADCVTKGVSSKCRRLWKKLFPLTLY